jgi:hypothetical protein
MTQEEKDLLLKDLCTRLPYNPMVEYKGGVYNVLGINHGRFCLCLCKPFMSHVLNESPLVKEVKPYLFPLSSMTEEQKKEYYDKYCLSDYYALEKFDWFNKNHFDYRGLIEKGLAIDATGKNIY